MTMNKFLPKVAKEGKRGYYPVATYQEWEELPAVYKAMEWSPIEVDKMSYNGKFVKEKTFVKNVVFDTYLPQLSTSAKVSVHRQEVQQILFCLHNSTDCHLYTVCEVEFENGVRWGAKWVQDNETGAFAIVCHGRYVGMQGGFLRTVPANIEETEDGFEYKQGYNCYGSKTINHYQYLNPFYNNK